MKKVKRFTTALLNIPILYYTSFVEYEEYDMRYCTTAAKFERDLRELRENDYKVISMSQYLAVMNGELACPEKAVLLVFVGGYENNYSLAFPILKDFNAPASIFIATELVGMDTYPRIKKFAPHFGWNQAQEMIDSGLVNIYPLWHPFDNGKDFAEEIERKFTLIKSNLVTNGEQRVFSQIGCQLHTPEIINQLGVEISISKFECFKLALC